MGLRWITGKVTILDEVQVKKYHRNTWISLGLMVTTGLFLFWPQREYLLGRPQFFIKIIFVIILVCNGFAIQYLQKIATNHAFKELTFSEKAPLLISGLVSSISWLGAFIAAFYISEY